jgi:hypothetical protein
MLTHAPNIRDRPIARERPNLYEVPSDPLNFFRGLAVALSISLLLWVAIARVAWWLWRV